MDQRRRCVKCHTPEGAGLHVCPNGGDHEYPAETGASDATTPSLVDATTSARVESVTIAPAGAYHATMRATTVQDRPASYDHDAMVAARWSAVESVALAAGWRVLGWRTYAQGEPGGPIVTLCTIDLYRTAADVQTGAVQASAGL